MTNCYLSFPLFGYGDAPPLLSETLLGKLSMKNTPKRKEKTRPDEPLDILKISPTLFFQSVLCS